MNMRIKEKEIPIFLRSLLLLLIILGIATSVQAQVTIGAGEPPHKDALLDLKENNSGSSSKGFLLPRVSLTSTTSASPLSDHVAGMTVYNTSTVNDVVSGYYYNDGTKWIRLMADATAIMPRFFYMPSIVMPTDTADPAYNTATQEFTIDLYNQYKQQFELTDPAASAKAPASTILPILASNELEYFITYYDKSVFQNITVSDTGILRYKLFPSFVYSEKTFMNIVFKVK